MPTVSHDTLTASDVRRMFRYDPSTGVLTWAVNPCRNLKSGLRAGWLDSYGYRAVSIAGSHYLEHRIIWLWVTGEWPSTNLDHINCQRDDNRWCNLREATQAQNTRNSRLFKTNRSGVKGVCYSKRDRKWRAKLLFNGKEYHVGLFDELEDAAVAIREKRTALHGEYANHG